MNEILIYEEGKIRITSNLFYNGHGESFVIPNIKGIRDVAKGKKSWPLIVGLVLLALCSHEWFAHSREVLGGLGTLMVIAYVMQKDKYQILIASNAGEGVAFTTKNEQQHKNILACLNRAWALHRKE